MLSRLHTISVLLSICLSTNTLASADINGKEAILARIGDEVITAQTLEVRLSHLPRDIREQYSTIHGKKKFLEELLRIYVFSQEAKAMGMDTDLEFKNKADEIINAILSHGYVKKMVFDPITIDDSEVMTYYENNKNNYMKDAQIETSMIQISMKRGPAEDNKIIISDIASELSQQLRNGVDIDTLLQKYPENVKLFQKQTLPIASFTPEVVDKIAPLRAGEISDPIELNNVYLIFFVHDLIPMRQIPFEKVQEEIKSSLLNAKRIEALKNKEKLLFDKYNIKLISNPEQPD
jgi:hypothetical protein